MQRLRAAHREDIDRGNDCGGATVADVASCCCGTDDATGRGVGENSGALHQSMASTAGATPRSPAVLLIDLFYDTPPQKNKPFSLTNVLYLLSTRKGVLKNMISKYIVAC